MLGLDGVKDLAFHTSNIKRYIIANSDKLSKKGKVAKLLKTVEGFKEGNFVTGADIKSVLANIYNEIGIDGKPSIDDFREFAVIESKVKKIDGKSKKGYIIQYIKVK